MAERMTTQEIVKNSYEVKNMKLNWESIYKAIYAASQTNKYRILRNGDTLFVIKILAPHEAGVMVFNAEKSFKNYIRNVKEFAKAMDIGGYTKVSAKGANIQMVNILKHAGYNVEAQPMDKEGKFFSIVGTKGGA